MTMLEQTDTIFLTEPAANAVRDLLAKRNLEGYALRVFISGGGCSGFQYGMDFVEKAEKSDVTIKSHGVSMYVDKDSLEMLRGTSIDYIESLQGSGFKISNPNVQHSCHCGKSFC